MKIDFKNYKPFQGKHSIEIKPFNVFIGRNNAGKSSLSEIICYATNIRFLSGTGDNIFRIDDTSRKDRLINYNVNYRKKNIDTIHSLILKIVKLEAKIAEVKFELKLIREAIKSLPNFKARSLSSRQNKDLIRKRVQRSLLRKDIKSKKLIEVRKKLKESYKQLLFDESLTLLPMWVLRSLIDPAVSMQIEINKGKKEWVEEKTEWVTKCLIGSKINQISEYLVPHIENGLGLSLKLEYTHNYLRRLESALRLDKRTIMRIADPKFPFYKDMYNDVYDRNMGSKELTRNIASFEDSKYFKLFSKTSNNFVNSINHYIAQNIFGSDQLQIMSVPDIRIRRNSYNEDVTEVEDATALISGIENISCELNVTDNDLDIFYKSDTGTVNQAHISYSKHKDHIYGEMPAKFAYLYDSPMYKNNIYFVTQLLKNAGKDFVKKVPLENFEGIFHENNCYYFETRESNPETSSFAKGVFPRAMLNARNTLMKEDVVSTVYQQTIDNLPLKIDKKSNLPSFGLNIIRSQHKYSLNKNLSNIPSFKFVYDKVLDKNEKIIYKKYGPQNLTFDHELNTQVHQDERLGVFENDVHLVSEYMTHPKIKDVVFPYFKLSKETNKVIGSNIDLKNIYADYLRYASDNNERIEPHRNIKSLYQHLLAKSMQIYEMNRLYVKHKNKTKKLRVNMPKKDLKIVEDVERFLIGGYLASTSSKILELVNAFIFYRNFNNSLASERAIKGFDTHGRRNHATMKATIIDPVIFPKKKGKAYDKEDLKALFGAEIDSITKTQATVKRLNEAVNAHLSRLNIHYKFEFGFFYYQTLGKLINQDDKLPDAYYLNMTEVDKESGKILGPPIDFNQVGQGTRNLIAIFVQIELAKRRKGGGYRDNLLVIREPENYLHPDLTGRFITYLISQVTGSRINIVLETHSEIIIRQLQVLVKNDLIDSNKIGTNDDYLSNVPVSREDLALYYIDHDDESGSSIREMKIDKEGYLEEEIPKNFLGINADLVTDLW